MEYQPSVMSRISCRTKPFQLDASVLGCEFPVDARFKLIPAGLPRRHLLANLLNASNAPGEALVDHDVQLDLRDIEPASALERRGGRHQGPFPPGEVLKKPRTRQKNQPGVPPCKKGGCGI